MDPQLSSGVSCEFFQSEPTSSLIHVPGRGEDSGETPFESINCSQCLWV